MISFFDIGSLFLIFTAVLEVKQTFCRFLDESLLELNIFSLVVRRSFKQCIGAIFLYGASIAEAEQLIF